jgi:hypothetical protein
MKNIFLICFVCCSVISFGQTSYDFAGPLPPGLPEVPVPLEKFHGVYQSFHNERIIEINENGIFARHDIVSKLSRELVRESSLYIIKNNYLYGLMTNDSLPVYSDSSYYYFIVPTIEDIVSETPENKLVKISNSSYVINFHENGTFTPCLISFIGRDLHIQYFDYETTVFDKLPVTSLKESDGMVTKTLGPTLEDFSQIKLSEIFGQETIYRKDS